MARMAVTVSARAGVAVLRLQVVDFVGPTRWRWRLTDAEGAVVAEHAVELDDTEWQFAAFADLAGHLRSSAVDQDRRLAHEAATVVQVGAWLGERVLGQIALELARAGEPVLLEVPPEAADLALRPWELALVENQPLAAYLVSFVVDQGPPTGAKTGVTTRLRMLAVFGQPADDTAANPRGQRYALARSVYRTASQHGVGVQLRVLPYGTTRDLLRDVLLEADGWDVVHVGGLAGGLPLVDEAGRPDVVTPAELADLLAVGVSQVKLVTLVGTRPQFDVADEHLRSLGLPQASADRPDSEEPQELPALAAAVARRAECAAVAMRHPVTEDFAVIFADAFYELVVGLGRPVGAAVPAAVTRIAGGSMSVGVPPSSVAAPSVFGASAGDLRLTAPPGEAYVFQVEQQRLAGFPPQPLRFVGRVAELNRAAAVLTEHSGLSGVALHGAAGIGKTALAIELAYTHQDAFGGLAWYMAPATGDDTTAALTDCALALERQLPGLHLANRAHDPEAWQEVLPALTEGLDRSRVLIVLDGVDSLLTETGEWRDERWARFVRAVTDHGGRSRVVITSRRPPAGLPATVLTDAVPALSATEAVTLALTWPRLRGLLDGTYPDLPADQARDLAGRALAVAGGHPTLLGLAEGAAGNPSALRARVAEAEERLRTSDQADPLAGWTEATVRSLPVDAALFFQFLCRLELADRADWVVTPTWPKVWQRPGDAPGPDTLGPVLAGHALVAVDTGYRIEPAIAETGRSLAGAEFAGIVDQAAADGWLGTQRDALDRDTEELGWLVRHATIAAMPYLERRGRWVDVVAAADQLLGRDRATATAAALLPHLSAAMAALRDTEDELAARLTRVRALATVDPAAAEAGLAGLVDLATARGDFAVTAVLVAELVELCRLTGRWEQCVQLTEAVAGHADRPGMGPWYGLLVAHARLRVLFAHGRYEQVLTEVTALDTTDLPEPPAGVVAWAVRETVAGLGADAARELGRWEQALELAAVVRRSQADRGAPEPEQAATALADHRPLLELGRVDEARDLVTRCRTTFEATDDVRLQGRALTALAEVEGRVGQDERAVELATEALRRWYQLADAAEVALGHREVADRLAASGADVPTVTAHLLASAVLEYQTGGGRLTKEIQALAALPPTESPLTFDETSLIVDRTPGVGFPALVFRLPTKAGTGQAAVDVIHTLVGKLRQEAVAQAVRQAVEAWEPVVAGLRVPAAADAVDQAFAAFESHPDWQDLVVVLRGIQAGEDPEVDNLTPVGVAVAQRARDVVAGTVDVDPEAWRALVEEE